MSTVSKTSPKYKIKSKIRQYLLGERGGLLCRQNEMFFGAPAIFPTEHVVYIRKLTSFTVSDNAVPPKSSFMVTTFLCSPDVEIIITNSQRSVQRLSRWATN